MARSPIPRTLQITWHRYSRLTCQGMGHHSVTSFYSDRDSRFRQLTAHCGAIRVTTFVRPRSLALPPFTHAARPNRTSASNTICTYPQYGSPAVLASLSLPALLHRSHYTYRLFPSPPGRQTGRTRSVPSPLPSSSSSSFMHVNPPPRPFINAMSSNNNE